MPISGNPEPDWAEKTAGALNAYLSHCHTLLTNHEVNHRRIAANFPPANFLATQRPGRRVILEPFDQRWGLKGMLVASGAVYVGLARELGLTPVRVLDSRDPSKDLRDRIRLALNDTSHDFIHVHSKVADEAAHTGNPTKKEVAIAALDRGLDELVAAVETRDDLLVAITADHSTPSVSPLIHSGEPVPIVLTGPTVRRDKVDTFNEVSAATGSLGHLRGKELMLMLLNAADRSSLVGHCLGKTRRPFFPHNYEPFKLTD
jgi:2,3-bisphosphoglycerate-independent phosphoglycerate mutase